MLATLSVVSVDLALGQNSAEQDHERDQRRSSPAPRAMTTMRFHTGWR